MRVTIFLLFAVVFVVAWGQEASSCADQCMESDEDGDICLERCRASKAANPRRKAKRGARTKKVQIYTPNTRVISTYNKKNDEEEVVSENVDSADIASGLSIRIPATVVSKKRMICKCAKGASGRVCRQRCHKVNVRDCDRLCAVGIKGTACRQKCRRNSKKSSSCHSLCPKGRKGNKCRIRCRTIATKTPRNCAGVKCARISCARGQRLLNKAGSCCPVCIGTVDRRCETVKCPQIKCARGSVLKTAKGQCCPTCTRTLNCANVSCPLITCNKGFKFKVDDGSCCGRCVSDRHQCTTVSCPTITCNAGQRYVVERGACCGKCVGNAFAHCASESCPKIRCRRDQVYVVRTGQCCGTCITPPESYCRNVACVNKSPCKLGQTMKIRKNECCGKCTGEAVSHCTNVKCPAIACNFHQRIAVRPGSCCGQCEDIAPARCDYVTCPKVSCRNGQRFVAKHGSCCGRCVGSVSQKCSTAKCPSLTCLPTHVFVVAKDQCCGSCRHRIEANIPIQTNAPCELENCPPLNCPRAQQYVRNGHCCPVCHSKNAVACPKLRCSRKNQVKVAGKRCRVCRSRRVSFENQTKWFCKRQCRSSGRSASCLRSCRALRRRCKRRCRRSNIKAVCMSQCQGRNSSRRLLTCKNLPIFVKRLRSIRRTARRCGDVDQQCVEKTYASITVLNKFVSHLRRKCPDHDYSKYRVRCRVEKFKQWIADRNVARSILQRRSERCGDEDVLCIKRAYRSLQVLEWNTKKRVDNFNLRCSTTLSFESFDARPATTNRFEPVFSRPVDWTKEVTCQGLKSKFEAWLNRERKIRQFFHDESCKCSQEDSDCMSILYKKIVNASRKIFDERTKFNKVFASCDECAPVKLRFTRWLVSQRARRHQLHMEACKCGSDSLCMQEYIDRIKNLQKRIVEKRAQIKSLHKSCSLEVQRTVQKSATVRAARAASISISVGLIMVSMAIITFLI